MAAGTTGRAIGLALVFGVATAGSAWAQKVIDGDSIELKGKAYRLYGIDAAEEAQSCADGWPAGVAARNYLTELIGDREVTCMAMPADGGDETMALCRAEGVDLGGAMVTGGHALAYVPYSARYITQEDAATAARRGLHGHRCLPPWKWRHRTGADG
ncbi:thermonuclease family protein [Reyranella sp.]|uniref:thermonuclease family protein n=1 Tax=Reyranella sp. TaxID=1929291 RepID=UPI003BAC39DB